MSQSKFNTRKQIFPWNNRSLQNFLSSEDFFTNDFFTKDSLMPAINVQEHNEDFEIEFAAPGFSKKDFEVTIDNNILHVSGEKSNEEEQNEEDYTRKEFNYSSFKRSLKIPENVNVNEEVKASYKNGILKLNLLKKQDSKEKQKKIIEVE